MADLYQDQLFPPSVSLDFLGSHLDVEQLELLLATWAYQVELFYMHVH